MWVRVCPCCRSIYKAQVEFCGIDGSALIQSDVDSLVGQHVDRYIVLELVGVGATGCVYRVQHSMLAHQYAMKILFGDLSQDARIVGRFEREAKAISMMRHPNILSVTDFGRTPDGLTFLVMEFIGGVTLEDEMIASGKFPIRRAARIVDQIAVALGEAHRHGFVHRDVKPMNVMLEDRDGEDHVKILDFGIVGLRTEAYDARLTTAGFLIGTPAYMAPEQACDPSGVTPAADFYSLGVMLYEMLTGELPFKATQPVEMIVQHSIAPVPPMMPAGGLERLAGWLLEKHPKDRPQSAEEILDELDRLCLDDDEQELPMLDPVTYPGFEPRVVYYERVVQRLESIRETVNGTIPIGSELRRTFDARLAEMIAAAKPGLDAHRYLDLAARISDMEIELAKCG